MLKFKIINLISFLKLFVNSNCIWDGLNKIYLNCIAFFLQTAPNYDGFCKCFNSIMFCNVSIISCTFCRKLKSPINKDWWLSISSCRLTEEYLDLSQFLSSYLQVHILLVLFFLIKKNKTKFPPESVYYSLELLINNCAVFIQRIQVPICK